MRKDERPLPGLEDAANLSGLALPHGDVKKHGALFAEVVDAEELGTLFDDLLSLEFLSREKFGPGAWRGL